ncbi:hypothetical protein BJ085DRAFT_34173 [Dimargaris cristalligena]|uniref:RING-type domain-containing protein n=1 Tax=Dimargaris cristalligena TaxID=215637 RepID=A0A4P9ZZ91_9FUNG|nr:hypothetical protein BJ085DRAFT_34173 [Dimargaris cristalligena]|eukprot:RKP38728.1 hypothetical protein BJ085DRAFT_34173 [Dimargaris cristalligena]
MAPAAPPYRAVLDPETTNPPAPRRVHSPSLPTITYIRSIPPNNSTEPLLSLGVEWAHELAPGQRPSMPIPPEDPRLHGLPTEREARPSVPTTHTNGNSRDGEGGDPARSYRLRVKSHSMSGTNGRWPPPARIPAGLEAGRVPPDSAPFPPVPWRATTTSLGGLGEPLWATDSASVVPAHTHTSIPTHTAILAGSLAADLEEPYWCSTPASSGKPNLPLTLPNSRRSTLHPAVTRSDSGCSVTHSATHVIRPVISVAAPTDTATTAATVSAMNTASIAVLPDDPARARRHGDAILQCLNFVRLYASYSHRQVAQSQRHDRVLSNLRENLVCSVCTEVYNRPYTLECGHSFCLECLQPWFPTSLTCPECRREVSRRPVRAYNLQNQADAMRQLEPADEEDTSSSAPSRPGCNRSNSSNGESGLPLHTSAAVGQLMARGHDAWQALTNLHCTLGYLPPTEAQYTEAAMLNRPLSPVPHPGLSTERGHPLSQIPGQSIPPPCRLP